MSWRFMSSLALGVGIIVSAAQPAASQQLEALSIGFREPAARAIALQSAAAPSTIFLSARGVWWAYLGAAIAGGAGLIVDAAYCEQRRGNEQGAIFGPCFLPAGAGTTVGWFGGAVVGGTIGAARVARRRGCPSRIATIRALAGAALGVAPGLSIVARRPGKYPPAHTALILGTPLLAGVGAAVAVAGC